MQAWKRLGGSGWEVISMTNHAPRTFSRHLAVLSVLSLASLLVRDALELLQVGSRESMSVKGIAMETGESRRGNGGQR